MASWPEFTYFVEKQPPITKDIRLDHLQRSNAVILISHNLSSFSFHTPQQMLFTTPLISCFHASDIYTDFIFVAFYVNTILYFFKFSLFPPHSATIHLVMWNTLSYYNNIDHFGDPRIIITLIIKFRKSLFWVFSNIFLCKGYNSHNEKSKLLLSPNKWITTRENCCTLKRNVNWCLI